MATPPFASHRVGILVGIPLLVGVLLLTLAPLPWNPVTVERPGGVLNPKSWLAAETWALSTPGELLANVAMFVPVGVVAALVLPRWAAVLGPALLTLGIECAQIPLVDRVSDPRDLVANLLGGVVGVLAVSLHRAARRPQRGSRDAAANART